MGTVMYQLAVPPGVLPGMQFQASVGGQVLAVTCPPGVAAGSVMQVPAPQPQTMVAPEQPVAVPIPPYVRDERPAKEKTPEELDAQDLDGCWWSVGCFALPPFATIAVGCVRNNPGVAPPGLSPHGQPPMRTQTFVNLLCPILPNVTHWRHKPGTKIWEDYDDCFGQVGNRGCDNQTVNGPDSMSESGMYCGKYWRC